MSDLNYIIVELLSRDASFSQRDTTNAAAKIERGLFKGILLKEIEKSKEIEKFIVIEDLDGAVSAFNTRSYTMVDFEVLRGRTLEKVFWRNTDDDQEKAFAELADHLAKLQAEKRVYVSDPEYIDTSTYKDVPRDLGGANAKFSSAPPARNTGSSVVGRGGIGGGYRAPGTTYHSDNRYRSGYVYKEDRKPTAFSRKSKNPTAEQLARMKEMVQQISAKKYEEPPLKPCVGDDLPDLEEDDYGTRGYGVYSY